MKNDLKEEWVWFCFCFWRIHLFQIIIKLFAEQTVVRHKKASIFPPSFFHFLSFETIKNAKELQRNCTNMTIWLPIIFEWQQKNNSFLGKKLVLMFTSKKMFVFHWNWPEERSDKWSIIKSCSLVLMNVFSNAFSPLLSTNKKGFENICSISTKTGKLISNH